MQIGRKNVHGKGGVRFKTPYTASKKKAQVRNLVTELIVYEKVTITKGMVKDVVKEFDHLVTLAKKGDQHSRRLAAAVVKEYMVDEKTSAMDKLFNTLVKDFKDRKGGYLRVLHVAPRKGDNSPCCVLVYSK